MGMRAYVPGTRRVGKVFDWDKAARLLAEKAPDTAVAGLEEDMDWTAGLIWKDGRPLLTPSGLTYNDCPLYGDQCTYLASAWATPVMEMECGLFECWVDAQGTEWDAETRWPESALAIVEGAGIHGR